MRFVEYPTKLYSIGYNVINPLSSISYRLGDDKKTSRKLLQMRKLHVIFLVSALAALFLLHCSQTRKFRGVAGKGFSDLKKTTVAISCAVERVKNKNFPLPRAPEDYYFHFERFCQKHGELSYERNVSSPLALFFVIDITDSTNLNFKGLKKTIGLLGRKLEGDGWKVEIGALGFGDRLFEFRVVDFSSVADFEREIGQWEALDREDPPQAGQLALSVALDKILAINAKGGARRQNVIVFAGDSPIYAEDSPTHSDFSVDALAKRYEESDVTNLNFYYSLPKRDFSGKKEAVELTLQSQIEEFVRKAKLRSKALNYPLGEQLLNAFPKHVLDVSTGRRESCEIQSATLAASAGAKRAYRDSLADIVAKLERREPLSFKLPADPEQKRYELHIVRCCREGESQECVSFDRIQFNYNFETKAGSSWSK